MKRQFTAVLCICLTLAAPCWANYNPRIGRFLQRDPVGPVNPAVITPLVNRAAAFVPDHGIPGANREYHDGMNLYQYGRSNPLIASDPSGQSMLVGTLMSGGIGGLLNGMVGTTIGDSESFWKPFVTGFVGGALGFGGGQLFAYAFSGAGLFATLGVKSAIGAGENVLAGYLDHRLFKPGDDGYTRQEILADAVIGGMLGGLFEGAGIAFRNFGKLGSQALARKMLQNRAWRRHLLPDVGLDTEEKLVKYFDKLLGHQPRPHKGKQAWYDPDKRIGVIMDPDAPWDATVHVGAAPWSN